MDDHDYDHDLSNEGSGWGDDDDLFDELDIPPDLAPIDVNHNGSGPVETSISNDLLIGVNGGAENDTILTNNDENGSNDNYMYDGWDDDQDLIDDSADPEQILHIPSNVGTNVEKNDLRKYDAEETYGFNKEESNVKENAVAVMKFNRDESAQNHRWDDNHDFKDGPHDAEDTPKIPCKILANIEKNYSKDNEEDNENYGKDKEEIIFDKEADVALNSDVNLVAENDKWYDDHEGNHIESVSESDHEKNDASSLLPPQSSNVGNFGVLEENEGCVVNGYSREQSNVDKMPKTEGETEDKYLFAEADDWDDDQESMNDAECALRSEETQTNQMNCESNIDAKGSPSNIVSNHSKMSEENACVMNGRNEENVEKKGDGLVHMTLCTKASGTPSNSRMIKTTETNDLESETNDAITPVAGATISKTAIVEETSETKEIVVVAGTTAHNTDRVDIVKEENTNENAVTDAASDVPKIEETHLSLLHEKNRNGMNPSVENRQENKSINFASKQNVKTIITHPDKCVPKKTVTSPTDATTDISASPTDANTDISVVTSPEVGMIITKKTTLTKEDSPPSPSSSIPQSLKSRTKRSVASQSIYTTTSFSEMSESPSYYLDHLLPLPPVTRTTDSGKKIKIDYNKLLQNEIAKRLLMDRELETHLLKIQFLEERSKHSENTCQKYQEQILNIEEMLHRKHMACTDMAMKIGSLETLLEEVKSNHVKEKKTLMDQITGIQRTNRDLETKMSDVVRQKETTLTDNTMQIQTLSEQVHSLQLQHENTEREHANAISQLHNEYKAEMNNSKNEAAQFEQKILLLENSLKKESSKKVYLEQSNAQLTANCEDMNRSIKKLETQLKHQLESVEKLKEEKIIQIQKLNEQAAYFQLQQESLERGKDEVASQLLSQQNKTNTLKEKIKMLEHTLQNDSKKTELLENTNAQLRADLKKKNNTIQNLEFELKHQVECCEKTKEEQSEKYNALQEEKELLETDFDDLLVQIALQKEETESYRAHVASLQKEVTNKSQGEEDADARTEKQLLQRELTRLQGRCQSTEGQFAELSAQNSELLDKIDHLEMTIDLLEGTPENFADGLVENLKTSHEEVKLKNEIQMLLEEKKLAQSRIAELEKSNLLLTSTVNANECNGALGSHQKVPQSWMGQDEKVTLRKAMDTCKALQASLAETHENAKREKEEIRSNVQDELDLYGKGMNDLNETLAAKELDLNDIRSECAHLRKEVSSLQATVADKSREIEKLQHKEKNFDCSDEGNSIEMMQQKIISLKNALETSELQRAEAHDLVLRERKANAESMKRLQDSMKRFYSTLSCGKSTT